MKNEEKLAKVRFLVEPQYLKLKIWAHGWSHIERVVEYAKKLAEMEGVDSFLCQVAAYCHDLGRLIEEERGEYDPVIGRTNHAELSVAPTEKILSEVGFDKNEKREIIEAVSAHQLKKYGGGNKIALVLQDADRKDGLGKWGAVRMASFNGQLLIAEPKNEEELELALSRCFELFPGDEAARKRTYDGVTYALDWYETLLNTESAKEYLKEDYLFSKNFLEKIKKIH